MSSDPTNDYNERFFIGNTTKDFDPDKIKINRSYGFYGDNDSKLKSFDSGKNVPLNEGKWDGGFLSGRAIKQEWDGNIKKIKVPIGLWASVSDDPGCTNQLDIKKRINAYWGLGAFPESIGPEGESYDNNQTNKKTVALTDDLATLCANTKNKTNKLDFTGSDDNSKCWVSVSSKNAGGSCVKSGIHPGSFCQLGDNVITSEYCSQCENVPNADISDNIDPTKDHYCNIAKHRICNKGKHDKCIGDEECGKWGVEREHCEDDYCGSWQNPSARCKVGWGEKYCSDPENFAKNIEKCKTIFNQFSNMHDKEGRRLFETKWADDACEGHLSTDVTKDNIFAGTCGTLCNRKTFIDREWCRNQANNFCKKGFNVFTKRKVNDEGPQNNCLDYTIGHVEEMEDTVGVIEKILADYLKTFKRVNHKGEEVFDTLKIKSMMEQPIDKFLVEQKIISTSDDIYPHLDKDSTVGNYVGCLMGKLFYVQATRDIIRSWLSDETDDKTVDNLVDKVISSQNTRPECFFEHCKQGQSPLGPNMNDTKCPKCSATMINNMSGATIKDDGKIINSIKEFCDIHDKPDPPPPSSDPDKPKPPHTSVDPSGSSSDPVKPDDKRKQLIMIGVGIIVFLLLIIFLTEVFGSGGKHRKSSSVVSSVASEFGKLFGNNN